VTVSDVSIPPASTEDSLLVVRTQWGTGHLINRPGLVVVYVVVNAGVILVVEGGSHHAGGVCTSAASDLDIGTLRIELSGANVVGRVEGEDLVAQDVVAGRDRGGDGDGPGAPRRAQLVGSPDARGTVARAVGDLAQLRDLEPLELLLVRRGAFAVAGGQVGEDGPVVGVRPGRPVQADVAASGDRGSVNLGVGGVDRADDVRAIDVAAIHGPCVVIPSRPADGALVGRPGRCSGVKSSVVSASNVPLANIAVGCNGSRHGEDNA